MTIGLDPGGGAGWEWGGGERALKSSFQVT